MSQEIRTKLLSQLLYLQCIGDLQGLEEETMCLTSLSDEKLAFYQEQFQLQSF
ncbi:hypothetical protein [Enterococcus sp. DIV1059_2]|uniref:hypothetical protein n=1 Tax=Enterococcus sp. DIV1059_2 TaxID=2774664 RepID=UPI003F686881